MNFRRIAALLALLVLPLLFLSRPEPARSASYKIRRIMLFNGGTFDSTRHVKWFDVSHANHVLFRAWSSKAAFHVSTDADSNFADSISTWVTMFSDSVSFMARDSAGTVVTASSLIPITTAHGDPYPMCADSVALTGAAYDTTAAWVYVTHVPVNMALRAPGNGSGIISRVLTVLPGTIQTIWGDGEMGKHYMGVAITPLRRATAATVNATVPRRVNGLKGFKLEAIIYSQQDL